MRAAKEAEDKNAAQGGIQVIARAASILRTLENHPNGLSLGQIAKSVELARSTVQRIVAALAAEDFVIASGPGDVRIGPGLVRIGASAGSNAADLIRPHLRALGETVGETVDLAVLSGGSTVFVDQVPGRQRLVALSAVGERFPLHCTANGKAILACFSPEDAEELIDASIGEHPDFPLKNRIKLRAELEQIRKSHIAFDLEEHGLGISAAGIALLDPMGRPIAVSIPVPAQRFADQKEILSSQLKLFRKRIRAAIAR